MIEIAQPTSSQVHVPGTNWSVEYMQAAIEKAREILGEDDWKTVHNHAFHAAGGKISSKKKMLKNIDKLDSERANLRESNPQFHNLSCKYCQFYTEPDICDIVEGSVKENEVCDWIQSSKILNEEEFLFHEIDSDDIFAFGAGLIDTQPYQHLVRDIALTPVGYLFLIEDGIGLRYSLSQNELLNDINYSHHWSREIIDQIIDTGRQKIIKSEINKGEDISLREVKQAILKADKEKRLVYGVVLEPDTIDAQGDIISKDEIEEAQNFFMINSQTVGEGHSKRAEAKVVQSFIAPVNFTLGQGWVKKGSWVLVTKIFDDDLWQAVLDGEFTGYSVGGYGNRIPADSE